MLVGSTPLRRLKFFLVAPRTPYFDILWSKPSAITKKKVGKNFGLLGTPADWVTRYIIVIDIKLTPSLHWLPILFYDKNID